MPHYRQLLRAVEACRPSYILEVGVWDGAHGAEMIRTALRYRSHVEYWGFDLFGPCPDYELPKAPVPIDIARKTLEATGAPVHLYPGNTRETLPAAMSSLPLMDFIFLDGGHSLETIESDWHCCAALLHNQSVAILDDYYPDRDDAGAKRLVDGLKRAPRYRVEVLEPPTVYPQLRVHMVKVTLA